MTHPDDFKDIFPQEKGPKHYKNYVIQPYEFISKNGLSFFQGVIIKYVVRYLMKDGIKDLFTAISKITSILTGGKN